ncbi:MAG: hypothetical protein JSW18_01680 [Candidatus Omnitrophota bacterium]|nr:MAG: hypothetical protein JSW18_01680 [Candidatus Omnitrophota bacterium]
MKKFIIPSIEDPEKFVNLFDADRPTLESTMFCVALGLKRCEVNAYWKEYVAYKDRPIP